MKIIEKKTINNKKAIDGPSFKVRTFINHIAARQKNVSFCPLIKSRSGHDFPHESDHCAVVLLRHDVENKKW